MMELPSEKLLHEVVTKELGEYCILDNEFIYRTESVFTNKINIYELMHLMKEWAFTKGYILQTGLTSDKKGFVYIHEISLNYYYREETEFEAVTKACEWMLEDGKVT